MNILLENQYKKILSENNQFNSVMKMLGFDPAGMKFFPQDYLENNAIFDTNQKIDIVATILKNKTIEAEILLKLVSFDNKDKILDYGSGICLLGIMCSPLVHKVDLYEPIDFMRNTFEKLTKFYQNISFIDKINGPYHKIFCRAIIGEFEGARKTNELKNLFGQFYTSLESKGLLIFNFHRTDIETPSPGAYDLDFIKNLVLQAGFSNFSHSKKSFKWECVAIK